MISFLLEKQSKINWLKKEKKKKSTEIYMSFFCGKS